MASGAHPSRFATGPAPNRCLSSCPPWGGTGECFRMQDAIWIAVTAGLMALSLAYAKLCEKA